MLRQNVGRLDRTLRALGAAGLAPIGLFALGGWHGNLIGILVVAFAGLLLVTSLTGFCPGYVPLGISTTGSGEKPAGIARR